MNPAELTAVEARRLIGARELSSVELVEACIAQIERIDPAVNAMVVRADERARHEARDADAAVRAANRSGALHGLPVAIKDIQDTAGIRTTYGSERFANNVPAADSGIVARIRAAGGIVIGKTNVPEFSIGANTVNRLFGATGNPFDVDAHVRRLVGRFGRCGCHEHGAARHRFRSRRQSAHSGVLQRRRRLPGDAGRRAERTAHDHADQLQRAGADGAHGGRRGVAAVGDRATIRGNAPRPDGVSARRSGVRDARSDRPA